MANATLSRPGQLLGQTADPRALFLKVFSGEVLTTFNTKTIMKEKTRVRNLSSGKSAQFPAIGKTKASYHTPGTEIVGDNIQSDEKTITIDDLLIADTFIARIDEAMSQYEVRSEYSRQMGDALAQTYDRNLLSLAVKAARDTTLATGLGKGAVGQADAKSVKLGSVTPAVQVIIDAAYAAAATFDKNNIPEEGRLLLVGPDVYYALVNSDKLLNLWYNPGNNGSYSDGKVKTVAGFSIVKTNNLSVDHTAAGSPYPDYNAKYGVNASDTTGLLYHPQALGTVKLLDLSSEMEYDIRRQGTLMVSKMAVGHGVLRPECLYELRAAV